MLVVFQGGFVLVLVRCLGIIRASFVKGEGENVREGFKANVKRTRSLVTARLK